MTTTPNGPVPDYRPIFMGSWLFDRTVMPSRALLTCEEPITAIPELQDGVVINWSTQLFADTEDYYTYYAGGTGYADMRLGFQSWAPPDTGRWGCYVVSFLPPTYIEWQTDWAPPNYVPFPTLTIPAAFGISAPLVVRWLSEWVDVAAMFPDATLLIIP